MSKKRLSEVELVKGATPIGTDSNNVGDLTEKETSLISFEVVQSVLAKYPLLKSEIEDVFCSVSLGSEWLRSNIPVLGGLTPIEVIQNGDLKLVLDTLNKMKYGDFCS